MKHVVSLVSWGSLTAALVIMAACASAPELAGIQSDLTALRTEVAVLSERFDKLDKRLSPPEPVRVTVGFAGRPVLGNAAAKVGIIEYSDFQCPYCQRFHTAVHPMLKKNYIDSGKVQMIFRDLPLEIHPLAKSAAVAANCAGAQGKYWEMADAMFSDQERLGDEFYRELAGTLELDMTAYKTCIEDPSNLKPIEQSVNEATALGIEGTPSFLIGRVEGDQLVNAVTVVGAQPYPVMAQIIDALLGVQPEPATN